MERKVIQMANSTHLVSLPMDWVKARGIEKGDELEIEVREDRLIVKADSEGFVQKTEIDLDEYGVMAQRFIYALYKKGIDEIKINLGSSSDVSRVREALSNETIGYEIVEQKEDYCVVKNVSGEPEGFDSLLKRTFLLLESMSRESLNALDEGRIEDLKNIEHLEESNNRFTTVCRRYLNKDGDVDYQETGPLYYIVETLENIGDQYKYLCQNLSNVDESEDIDDDLISIYEEIDEVVQDFHECFYDPSVDLISSVGEKRKEIVDKCLDKLDDDLSHADFILLHHMLSLTTQVFTLLGPFFVLFSDRIS